MKLFPECIANVFRSRPNKLSDFTAHPVKDGDVVIFKYKGALTEGTAARIRDYLGVLEKSGIQFLLIDDDFDVMVLRAKMPNLPKSHCTNTTTRHKLPEQKRNSNAMGYNYRWQKFRESFLRKNPLCIECRKNGIVKPATDVDHIVPHRGDMKLFWKAGNHQPLCRSHHSEKTARGE